MHFVEHAPVHQDLQGMVSKRNGLETVCVKRVLKYKVLRKECAAADNRVCMLWSARLLTKIRRAWWVKQWKSW